MERSIAKQARWLSAVLLGLCACQKAPAPPELDDPLAGLTEDELERFELGEELFEGTFTAEQGLGPLFNAEGCAVCHVEPVDGGAGPIGEVHVSGIGPEGTCSSLVELGGPVIQQRATEALTAALGITEEPVPAEATARALRTTPDVFGLGLLDAIPDATILALADPDDRDGDGVSGRAHWLPGGHLGRFGRKAVVAGLADFNEGAIRIELGLTTPNQPEENSIAGAPLPAGVDPTGEPELPAQDVALITDYVRFLAPPAPARMDIEARRGQGIFARIGCAACHLPTLRTGRSEIRVLDRATFHPYTDLLLHDMGPELDDGYTEGRALSSEWRTPPLWEMFARKDMYRLGPEEGSSENLEVALRFREFAGTYMEHCHNTQHEDHAMLLRWDLEYPGQLALMPAPIPTWDGVSYVNSAALPTFRTGSSGGGGGGWNGGGGW